MYSPSEFVSVLETIPTTDIFPLDAYNLISRVAILIGEESRGVRADERQSATKPTSEKPMASTTQDIDAETETVAPVAESNSGLDENVAGALSYLFGLVTGLLFFLIEKDNRFVRWHAAQSMAFSGLLFVAYIAVSVVGTVITTVMFTSTNTFFIGSIVSLVLGLVWLVLALGGFVAWVYLMIKAYQGESPRLPVAAGIADKLI